MPTWVTPSQNSTIKPFGSYLSKDVNLLHKLYYKDGYGIAWHSNNFTVTLNGTNPTYQVDVSTGICVKDFVVIQSEAISTLDIPGAPTPTDGTYYVVIDYMYQIIKPAPQMTVRVIDSSTYTTDQAKPITPIDGNQRHYLGLAQIIVSGNQITEIIPINRDLNHSHTVKQVAVDVLLSELAVGVVDGSAVYFNTSTGKFDLALADGTIKQKVVGIANVSELKILMFGLRDTTGLTPGTFYYLSDTTPGALISTLPTNNQIVRIGIALENDRFLIDIDPPGGGGSGSGDITQEDLLYNHYIDRSPFNLVYYDKFPIAGTVIKTANVTYDVIGTQYTCSTGGLTDYVMVDDLVTIGNGSGSFRKFQVHVDVDDIAKFKIEYRLDGAGSWVEITNNEITDPGTNWSWFSIKISWNTSGGELYSFGVLFQEEANMEVNSNLKFLETVTMTSDHVAPYIIGIPNGKSFTVDDKSLEVYRNGIRQIVNDHYEELSPTSIRFLVDLYEDDIIVMQQYYGYVDTSIENQTRLDLEHDTNGIHQFYDDSLGPKIQDRVTGTWYRIQVENGTIVLEEL